MNNITSSCTLDITDLKRVPQELAKPAHILLPGDILFCHTNSQKLVGKTTLFNLQEGKYAFSNHLTRLRISKDGPIPEWIWHGLATPWRNRYFETRLPRRKHDFHRRDYESDSAVHGKVAEMTNIALTSASIFTGTMVAI
jgi:hypothetical protein